VDLVRPSKTTKEMENDELEMLKRPEARETTAFDPSELQGLIALTREDDLAVPIDPASPTPPLASASSPILSPMPATNDWDDVPGQYADDAPSATMPRVARGSAKTPKASRPIAPVSRSSLLPWMIVALAAAIVVALAFWRLDDAPAFAPFSKRCHELRDRSCNSRVDA
jgi:hypothetical protein